MGGTLAGVWVLMVARSSRGWSSTAGLDHARRIRRLLYGRRIRAVVCPELGPVQNLQVEERPPPALGPDGVRIAVAACGVNYVEGLMVQGLYQIKIPAPFVPGMEIVGTITEVGGDVTDRRIGERVFANVGIGGYVSEAVVPP